MSALGVTALEDAAVTPEIAQAYATLERRGQLDLRANLCQVYSPSAEDAVQLKRFTELRRSFTGRRLTASCVKIFLDGAYGSHTLVLLAPYSDEPARFGSGKLFVEQGRLDRLVSALDAADFQVHMHAQGDGAVRAGLNAIAAARHANGERGTRHTLAHLALIADEDVPRFRKLGVVANMTPLWSLDDPWETVFAPRLFGTARFAEMYRTRTLLDSGAVLVWGTDWPVTGVSPLDGIETATTHRYPGGRGLDGQIDHSWKPEERVSLEQALVAYTSSGAYLLHEEAQRGSLTAGKQADLVVLDRNLFDSPALEIHAAQVDMTVSDGRIVYERAGADR